MTTASLAVWLLAAKHLSYGLVYVVYALLM